MLDDRAITQLVTLAIRERDAILSALTSDQCSQATQQNLADWHAGRVDGWIPMGDTLRLLGKLRPRSGYSNFHETYQQANSDAIELTSLVKLLLL